jgi:N-glycosylase/DNA lyase
MQQEESHLQEEIRRLNDERQAFITKARKERMPDGEFTSQLSPLYDKERGVQRRLTAIKRAKDNFRQLDLEEQVKKYVAELQSEMTELIHANPQTLEEKHQVFLRKKHIVNRVLAEARVDENRDIHVKFRAEFLPPA